MGTILGTQQDKIPDVNSELDLCLAQSCVF